MQPCSFAAGQDGKGILDSERLERIEKLLEVRDFRRLEDIALNQQKALEVIRAELAEIRKDRDRLEKELASLSGIRSDLGKLVSQVEGLPGRIKPVDVTGLGSRLSELADAVIPLPGSIIAMREAVEGLPTVIGREFAPVRNALDVIAGRLDEAAKSYEAARSGLLAAFAEARAELIKARAEAEQRHAEAERLRAETEKQLLEARGTLGQRLLWFTVCLVGALLILLFGLAVIIVVLSRLGSKIGSLLSMVK